MFLLHFARLLLLFNLTLGAKSNMVTKFIYIVESLIETIALFEPLEE